jgi:hypothetical protein
MPKRLEPPFTGCLYTDYCYQSGASKDVTEQVETMIHFWCERLSHKLEAVNQRYPSRIPTTYTQVAGHVLTTFESAFILSKLMKKPKLAPEQLFQCRNHIELLYESEG